MIEDISTWADNSPKKSKLERFDSFTEALGQFQAYREKDAQFYDDKARTTFGVSVHGIEFDVIHARNDENVLSLDFTHSSEAVKSHRFMDDLQILCNVLVDKVRVHRDMSPEEIKNFVKERLKYQLHSSGLDDISMYMSRFDILYGQGKMEHLMPTASQKHIVEDIPLAEWENPYISINNRYADIADKELSVVEYEILLGMEPAQVSVDGLVEIMNSRGELWNYSPEEKEDCLQGNIPVVMVCDSEETRYFEIPKELVAKVRESEFRGYEPEQMAFAIGDKFVSIQFCEGGYDYSIFHADYTLIDGGVYDNPDITIHAALKDILEDTGVSEQEELVPADYGELMEKTEAVEQARIQEAIQAKQIVSDFKAKTNEMFHEISGLDAGDMEMAVMAHILSKIDDYGLDVEIMDIAVTGSRCRGLEQENSDIDIVVEYKGGEREDDLFRVFNEDGLKIGGVRVDINPITEGKTGTLAAYLPGVESYLEEKRVAMEQASVKEQAAILAAEINEFLCFCNPRQYEELVKDRDAQVASIRKNIEKGNTKYLSDFLNSVIAMGVRDGVTDIFGEGTKPDDSRPVQMARRAKALLDRLAEYKPLAKENLNDRISIKEKLAEKKAVIENEEHGDIFGIEKEDWMRERSLDRDKDVEKGNEAVQPVVEGTVSEEKSHDTYKIYQLKSDDELWQYHFENLESLKDHDLKVEGKNYELKYEGEWEEGMHLEGIYTKFNIERPEDFTGHSLSVGDIVVLNRDEKETAHFVDSVGFVEVPEFFMESVQEQTRVEMAESIEDGDEIIDLGDDREAVLAQIRGSNETEVQDTSGQDVQKQKPDVEITLTVAECGEFHNMGEFYENIPTVDEAIALFEKIPPERMNGIPAIGINLHRAGEDVENDIAIDLVGTKSIDLDVLQYVPDIVNEPKAMEVVAELIAKLPDREIDGNLSPELEAKVWEIRMPQLSEEEKMAVKFDRLCFDYDTILYNDSVRNMSENVEELTQEIKAEGTERISDVLREIIAEGAVLEEVDRAKKLLDKLTEYKPLAKVEEVEEQNYNMIDNVLNNGAAKAKKEADRKEMDKPRGRVSLKERLAEKKAIIAGNDKSADTQENVKKNQREM